MLLTVTGAWNEELIRDTLVGIDADAILQIAVKGQGDDVLFGLGNQRDMGFVLGEIRI